MNFRYTIVLILFFFTAFLCNAKIAGDAKNILEKGKVLYDNEQYSEATSLYLKAMKTAKENKDMLTYTKGLYKLGMVYVRMDDIERALYYFNLCYENAKSLDDKVMQGKCVSYMACCYGFAKNIEKAKYYFRLQQTLPDENENIKQYYLLFNGGLISFLEKNNDRALQQFHLAIDCVRRHRLDKKYLQSVYGIMVYIQLYKNDVNEALRFCEEYKRATQHDNKKLWKEAYYEMICDVYKSAGDSSKAGKYRRLADSTFNARIAKQQIKAIDNSIVKFEGESNRKDILALNSTVSRQWSFILVCVFFVVVLIALVAVIVIKNRKLKHAYQLVISRNRELAIVSLMSKKLRDKSSEPLEKYAKPINSLVENDNESKLVGNNANDVVLTQEQIDDILSNIVSTMENVEVISKSDFTLGTLAKMIGSNTRYVSWVINNTYNKNFKTLLNEYRIREVCRRMEDTEHFGHLTIQGLYTSMGYSSPSNFLRAFKNVNGMTPSTYLKLIDERKKQADKDADVKNFHCLE